MRNGLQTVNRPDQIGYWMQHLRRDIKKTPKIEDLDQYTKQWWAWWRGLQPDWRATDSNDGPLLQDGTGDWEKLRRPGRNGILHVLLSLWWWKSHPSANDADWLVAVDDVQWALCNMLQRTERKRSSESADEGAGTASKRRRK
ncbi:hypothetical protein EIP86_009177 [Pleurotus ostreatoroseus]|nr:hypothetical protein EIP86_009177 [Pleurotus ostreatoroseus]